MVGGWQINGESSAVMVFIATERWSLYKNERRLALRRKDSVLTSDHSPTLWVWVTPMTRYVAPKGQQPGQRY